MSVRDLLPTFLDLAEAEFPARNASGQPTVAPHGRSAIPILAGDTGAEVHAGEAIGFDSRVVRYMFKDQWKIPMGPDERWELYDPSTDRSEASDLAATNPEQLRAMVSDWGIYEERVSEERPRKQ